LKARNSSNSSSEEKVPVARSSTEVITGVPLAASNSSTDTRGRGAGTGSCTAGMVLHRVTVLMQTRDRLAVLTFVNPDPINTSWATQLPGTLASRLAG
jgi:hypothetical protein